MKMMTEKQFRDLCKNSGYARADIVDDYIKKHNKLYYSDADIDGDDGEIVMIFDQKPSTTEVK